MRLARAVRAELAQEHRYAHTVRVARLAERLAAAHRIDPHRARLAGMLHDLARLYPAERLLRECADRRMTIDPFEAGNPIVLHARLSAVLARERYGIADPDILSAIRKHMVAAEVMSPLDAVVYLA
ncbi:MAG: bis(5'-nucleosyl)-tetraphosphatase (symmetrical) YqeK, partial [Candidatus Elarobacter sp.]